MKKLLLILSIGFSFVLEAQVNRYSQPAETPTNQEYYKVDYEQLNQALENKQARYDIVLREFNNLIDWIKKLKNEVTETQFNEELDELSWSLNFGKDNMDLSIIPHTQISSFENSIKKSISDYEIRMENIANKRASDIEETWNKAKEQYKNGDINESIKNFNLIVKERPNVSSSYFYLAYNYLDIDDILNARKNLNIFKSLEPSNLSKNELEMAVAFEEKNYYEVIKNANIIIETEPNNYSAYLTRGRAKSKLKDYYGSIKDNKKAIEIKPNFSMAYNNLSWDYFLQKKYDEALLNSNKAIALDNTNYIAYDSRADIKFALKDYQGCINDCKSSLSLNSKQTNPYFLLGRANYRIGNKQVACENWSKSGELGNIEAYDYISKYCQ